MKTLIVVFALLGSVGFSQVISPGKKGGGTGTVTTISGSGPAWLTWGIATATTTPVITLTATTGQTPHQVIGTCGSATTFGPCALVAADLPTAIRTISCQPGLGDGLNAITAGTYLQSICYNDTGAAVTITGVKCFTDNSGTSTLAATNGAGTALLTGAVTCTTAFAAGTQSATATIASGDFIKFTFVADGTSKQTTWVVTELR